MRHELNKLHKNNVSDNNIICLYYIKIKNEQMYFRNAKLYEREREK
jgi:hypothetical protein